MKAEQFNEIINEQISRSLNTLTIKSKEYTTEDKLYNFKIAATLKGETSIQALSGMMVKHTVSIYDMCRDGDRDIEKWNEKITDHINYLLILRALVEETECR